MIVRKLRLSRGWSQQQLAEFSGLSVRTIQRIERGQVAGNESLKALAAVFETDVSTLIEESDMLNQPNMTAEEREAIEYVRDIKGFYNHAIQYLVVMALLLIINVIVSPDYYWVVWPALGWGLGVVLHGLNVHEVFSLFGPHWEKKQINRYLRQKKS